MNDTGEFVAMLRRHGWVLWVEAGELFFDAPETRETDEALAVLAEYDLNKHILSD